MCFSPIYFADGMLLSSLHIRFIHDMKLALRHSTQASATVSHSWCIEQEKVYSGDSFVRNTALNAMTSVRVVSSRATNVYVNHSSPGRATLV